VRPLSKPATIAPHYIDFGFPVNRPSGIDDLPRLGLAFNNTGKDNKARQKVDLLELRLARRSSLRAIPVAAGPPANRARLPQASSYRGTASDFDVTLMP
jgi:hypothetical protein